MRSFFIYYLVCFNTTSLVLSLDCGKSYHTAWQSRRLLLLLDSTIGTSLKQLSKSINYHSEIEFYP